MSRHDEYDERFAELARLSYQVAYRLTGDRHEAEDHAQEALTRAYLRWPRMHHHAEPWIVRVTTNLVIGRWRRLQRPHPQMSSAAGADLGAAERLALVAALRSLPRRQRQVAALRYLGDLSIEATAAELGCSIGTVKQHSARALAALRAHPELRDHVDADLEPDPDSGPTPEPGADQTPATPPPPPTPTPDPPRPLTARSHDVP